jgi:hypothetical protein
MTTMTTTLISIQEEDALRRILAHHDALTSRRLVQDLSALVGWVRETEAAKGRFERGTGPMPMLSLLSTLGIYGGEAICPTPNPPAATDG